MAACYFALILDIVKARTRKRFTVAEEESWPKRQAQSADEVRLLWFCVPLILIRHSCVLERLGGETADIHCDVETPKILSSGGRPRAQSCTGPVTSRAHKGTRLELARRVFRFSRFEGK